MLLECITVPSKRIGEEIKIINIKDLISKKKIKVFLSSGEVLEISENVFTNYNLYINKVLSPSIIKKIKKENDLDTHLNYAIKLATSSIISTKEIKNRLSKRGLNEKDIKYILDYLDKYSLVDELSNIKDKVSYYDYRYYGKNKIIDELYKAGYLKKYIDLVDFSSKKELNKANALIMMLNKKYKSLPYLSKKNKAKAYLYQKGFDDEIISESIKKIEKEDKKSVNEKLKKDYLNIKEKYKKKYNKNELEEKIIGYLIRKGYHYEDIKKIVR